MPGSKILPKTSEESYFVLLTSRVGRVLVRTKEICEQHMVMKLSLFQYMYICIFIVTDPHLHKRI